MTRHILIVAPSWIGDMVMAQPLLARLKQQSSTETSVLALPWIAPLLSRINEVDSVVPMPIGHGRLAIGARYRLGRSLRNKYQQAIVLPNTLKSALIPWFAGIPERTGYRGEMRYGLLNDIRLLDESLYPLLVQRYLALAEDTGSKPTPVTHPHLTVKTQQVEQTLAALALSKPDKAVVGLCPGAEYGAAKRWPVEHYAELARRLIEKGNDVWLFGSAKDKTITRDIQRLSEHACIDLAGVTSLDQAIDLMSLTRAVVTNDSGLMHIAAALGRPVVALFGSTSAAYTPPLSDQAEIVQHELECSPCFERECPLGHLRCLQDIGADEVMTRLQPQLEAG